MRNRYFSPQTSYGSFEGGIGGRGRWMGSTSKLIGYSSLCIGEDTERRIGVYSYESSRQIGSGYSSKVYKGVSSRDKEQYAIKVIELKKYSPSSLQMLESEIQILKTLDHPNVIKCFDVYKTPTHCYIVTEYCPNGDLLSYLSRRGKLQESVATQIMAEVIEGVKYLLKRGILHRDLKPANILNNKKTWKIADFGFAMHSQQEVKTRYNVGTPLYMPPQALVKNVYSPLSDIFSIGVIFYELMTGITPWECKSQKELIKKMTSLPFSLSQRHQISTHIRQILHKLCAIDPKFRCSRQEFLQLKLKKGEDQNPEQLKRPKQETGEELMRSTSSVSLLQSKVGGRESEARVQTKNNHILINQLHYCRFIYYLTRNVNNLLVSSKSRNKISLVLYRHLQKLIKNLTDDKNNLFKLANWDSFKDTKKYYTTLLTMKEYAVRYEKQYLNFLKNADLNTIRDINKEINELSSQSFSPQFYRTLLATIAPLIREFNHNLTLQINRDNLLTLQVRGQIEGIKALYKYYQLVKISAQQFEDFQGFQKKSDIKVQIDYRSSPNVTVEQFMQLRQQLKFI